MKTKKNLIFVTLVVALFVWSCAKHEINEQNIDSAYETYLDLSSYDPLYQLNTTDLRIFDEALKRFGFFKENQELKYHASSAASINISDKLYSLIASLVMNCNNPMTKSSQPNDCVACALSWWGDYTYQEISNYISIHYGDDGVPSDCVFDIIRYFYPSAIQCSPDSLNAGCITNTMSTMGYFETGENGNAHMVNIDSIDSTYSVTYLDVQNCSIGSLPLSDFSMIYFKQ